MSDILILKHCNVFDGVHGDIQENVNIIIEDTRIREICVGATTRSRARTVDLFGRYVMPGLLDLHCHAYSVSFDMQALDRMPKPLLISYAIRHLEGALQRGFTTVRDPGGGDVGLSLAIEHGLVQGPRFLYGGKAFSQTGGHGDMRPAHQEATCGCGYSGVICQVVDGVDELRRAAREELRKGADHLKVFISGGVGSPTDPMWMPQFTDEEIKAVVHEAASRRRYVAAHCLTDDGARRCVLNGVRSIEHGISISRETARLIADSGSTYVVPTLAVLHQIANSPHDLGLFPESIPKAKGALERVLGSIENCNRAGVKLGLGTDIFGTLHHYLQGHELGFRAEVSTPLEVLRSATSINAEIVQRAGELGIVAPQALADLIVLEADPLRDLSQFERPSAAMPVIIKGGRIMKNTIARRQRSS